MVNGAFFLVRLDGLFGHCSAGGHCSIIFRREVEAPHVNVFHLIRLHCLAAPGILILGKLNVCDGVLVSGIWGFSSRGVPFSWIRFVIVVVEGSLEGLVPF